MEFITGLGFLLNMIFLGIVMYGYLENKVPGMVAIFWGLGHFCLAQVFLWKLFDVVIAVN